MLRLLVDTDVWLQIVQDHRNAALIEALKRMITTGEVAPPWSCRNSRRPSSRRATSATRCLRV